MKKNPDINLVQAYLNGNLEAENRFYNEFSRLINGLIRRMELRGTTFYDRENVIAEILYQIMVENNKKVLRNYKGQSRLTTYLWPVVRYKIIDIIRKEKSHHNRHLYQESLDENSTDSRSSAANIAVEIEESIARESPLDQFIKISKWMEELSYQDIIHRAKQNFHQEKPLTIHHIAYVLNTNRKKLKKKFKKCIT